MYDIVWNIYLSIYLSIYLPTYLSIYLSISLCISLFFHHTHLFTYPTLHLPPTPTYTTLKPHPHTPTRPTPPSAYQAISLSLYYRPEIPGCVTSKLTMASLYLWRLSSTTCSLYVTFTANDMPDVSSGWPWDMMCTASICHSASYRSYQHTHTQTETQTQTHRNTHTHTHTHRQTERERERSRQTFRYLIDSDTNGPTAYGKRPFDLDSDPWAKICSEKLITVMRLTSRLGYGVRRGTYL